MDRFFHQVGGKIRIENLHQLGAEIQMSKIWLVC
jgi:hypothetical protein